MEGTFFYQPIKNGRNAYESIRKIEIGQGDAYITGCLLDYNFFKTHKMITTDSSKLLIQDSLLKNRKKQF